MLSETIFLRIDTPFVFRTSINILTLLTLSYVLDPIFLRELNTYMQSNRQERIAGADLI